MDLKYLPQMQHEDKHRYVFVAIDSAARWVFIAIKPLPLDKVEPLIISMA